MHGHKHIERIMLRLRSEIFDRPIMDNTMRGLWVECMVAEALGSTCSIVSHGWHPWDLQLGRSADEYPRRIRIQVKNTARLQTWEDPKRPLTECLWTLAMRPRPAYFDRYNDGVACEEYGFLCDLFILALHDNEDRRSADQRCPDQWRFFLVPVVGPNALFQIKQGREGQRSNPSYTVKPATLQRGIRGRPPVNPVPWSNLTSQMIGETLAI